MPQFPDPRLWGEGVEQLGSQIQQSISYLASPQRIAANRALMDDQEARKRAKTFYDAIESLGPDASMSEVLNTAIGSAPDASTKMNLIIAKSNYESQQAKAALDQAESEVLKGRAISAERRAVSAESRAAAKAKREADEVQNKEDYQNLRIKIFKEGLTDEEGIARLRVEGFHEEADELEKSQSELGQQGVEDERSYWQGIADDNLKIINSSSPFITEYQRTAAATKYNMADTNLKLLAGVVEKKQEETGEELIAVINAKLKNGESPEEIAKEMVIGYKEAGIELTEEQALEIIKEASSFKEGVDGAEKKTRVKDFVKYLQSKKIIPTVVYPGLGPAFPERVIEELGFGERKRTDISVDRDRPFIDEASELIAGLSEERVKAIGKYADEGADKKELLKLVSAVSGLPQSENIKIVEKFLAGYRWGQPLRVAPSNVKTTGIIPTIEELGFGERKRTDTETIKLEPKDVTDIATELEKHDKIMTVMKNKKSQLDPTVMNRGLINTLQVMTKYDKAVATQIVEYWLKNDII